MVNRFFRRINLATQVLMTGKLITDYRREIPAITPDQVAEAKQFFPMEKFFIFGHARSGTTLLTRLVRLHPQVHCNYQAHFFTRPPLLEGLVADIEVGKWLTRSSNRWNRGKDLSAVVLRAVSDFILERDARQAGKSVVGDKSPNSLLNGESVDKLYKIYPDARLIFIIRDGRDTAVSHRIQTFVDQLDRLSGEDLAIREALIRNPLVFKSGERSIFTQKGLLKAANSWVRNLTETEELGQRLFGERYLHLRYEDLLEKPLEELFRIWGFLGVETNIQGLEEVVFTEMNHNPDADWQQEAAEEIVRALSKGKRGTWREMFTSRDIKIFEQIAGEELKRWGYDSGVS